MAFRVGGVELPCDFRFVFPFLLNDLIVFETQQAPLVAPRIAHDAMGPRSIRGGYVDAVVFMPVAFVSHTAAEAEVDQGAPAQFPVQIVLIVPAKTAFPYAKEGVDHAIVEPALEEGGVVSCDCGGGFMGGIGQPAGFFPGAWERSLFFRQQR